MSLAPCEFVSMTAEASLWTPRFSAYFDRPVAQTAAKTLSDGAEIEFKVEGETFTFTRVGKRNAVHPGTARDPQIAFTLSAAAAEAILNDPAEDVGSIGVAIMKLVFTHDPLMKLQFQLRAGFFTLFTRGYFGVLKSGGSALSGYLSSRGMGGFDAVQAAIKKLRK